MVKDQTMLMLNKYSGCGVQKHHEKSKKHVKNDAAAADSEARRTTRPLRQNNAHSLDYIRSTRLNEVHA